MPASASARDTLRVQEGPRTSAFGNSYVGRREQNEDAYCIMPHLGLYVVADGMGGQAGGEVAANLVVSTMVDVFEGSEEADYAEGRRLAPTSGRQCLELAMERAQRRVAERATGPHRQMGSTVAAMVLREDQVVIGHVGDSRVYRLRAGSLEQLTIDHSLCAELEASSGRVLDSFMRQQIGHLVTRCIAAQGASHADIEVHQLEIGDVYLLCSDGLSDVIVDEELEGALSRCEPQEAANFLVDVAFRKGSTDNITAVVVKVER